MNVFSEKDFDQSAFSRPKYAGVGGSGYLFLKQGGGANGEGTFIRGSVVFLIKAGWRY